LCAAFLGFLPAATHFYLHSNFSSPSRVSADVSAANENLESAVAAVNERQSALSEAARAVRLDGAGVGGRRYCAPNAHARPCCLGFYGIYGTQSERGISPSVRRLDRSRLADSLYVQRNYLLIRLSGVACFYKVGLSNRCLRLIRKPAWRSGKHLLAIPLHAPCLVKLFP
jgi:hypothetical protein